MTEEEREKREEELRREDREVDRFVARAQAGETEVFGEVYRLYFDRVHAYLRIALGEEEGEGEDIAQLTFLQALEALPGYKRGTQPFRSWLFAIARHRAIDHLRTQGRLEPTDPAELDRLSEEQGHEEPDFAESLAGSFTLSWINDVEVLMLVERLPLPQRQVLVLNFMLGLRAGEIAGMLDRTPSDVRKLQSRALEFLRERLIALGRGPGSSPKDDAGIQRAGRQATVLRRRRFALMKR